MDVGSGGVSLVVPVATHVDVLVAVAVLVGRFCSAGMAAASREKRPVERRVERSIFEMSCVRVGQRWEC